MSEKRRVSTRKRRRRCEKKRYLNIGYSHVIDLKRQERRQTNKQTNKEKMNSLSGIRTPVFHVTGEDT